MAPCKWTDPLVIPEGLAHGFQTLTADCEMLYFHTAAYQPGTEGGLNIQDPKLAIQWPLPITERSARDTAHPMLAEGFTGVAA
jgi:dTDP-4-dehydrorhamnose 3,5-epimerase